MGDKRAHHDLEAIRAAIASGDYRVDALAVADAVLERWRRFDVLVPAESPTDGQSASTGTASDSSRR